MKNVKDGAINFASFRKACDAHKIDYMTAYMRVQNGWSVSKALRTPVRPRKAEAAPRRRREVQLSMGF